MSDTTPDQPGPAPLSEDQPVAPTAHGTHPARNPVLLVLAVLLVAVVVVAVVMAGGSPAKPKPVLAAPTAFTDAVRTTFKAGVVSASFSLAVAAGATSFKLTGTGGWDEAKQAGEFVENVSGSPEFDAFGPLTELVVNKTVYLKFGPAISAVIPTPWVSTALKDPGSPEGANPIKVPGSDAKDLSELPALLSSLQAILHVEKVGEGSVDGVSVTKYESSFNTATAISELKSKFPLEFQGASAPSTAVDITVKAAVDRQGRLRQLSVDATTTTGRAASVALTLNFTSFDASASYQAPSANQVTPLTALLARGKVSIGSKSTSVIP